MSSSVCPASARPIRLSSSRSGAWVALMPARKPLIMSGLNGCRGWSGGITLPLANLVSASLRRRLLSRGAASWSSSRRASWPSLPNRPAMFLGIGLLEQVQRLPAGHAPGGVLDQLAQPGQVQVVPRVTAVKGGDPVAPPGGGPQPVQPPARPVLLVKGQAAEPAQDRLIGTVTDGPQRLVELARGQFHGARLVQGRRDQAGTEAPVAPDGDQAGPGLEPLGHEVVQRGAEPVTGRDRRLQAAEEPPAAEQAAQGVVIAGVEQPDHHGKGLVGGRPSSSPPIRADRCSPVRSAPGSASR